MVAEPILTGARFTFSVKDVDILWERLRVNMEIAEALFGTPHVTREFTIRDLNVMS